MNGRGRVSSPLLSIFLCDHSLFLTILTHTFLFYGGDCLDFQNCGNSRQYVLMHKSSKDISVRFNDIELQIVKDEPASTQTIDGLLASRYFNPAPPAPATKTIRYKSTLVRDEGTGVGMNDNIRNVNQIHTKGKSVRRRIEDFDDSLALNTTPSDKSWPVVAQSTPPSTSIQTPSASASSFKWWEDTMGYTPTLPLEQRIYGQQIESATKPTKPVIKVKNFNVTIDGDSSGPMDLDYSDWTVQVVVKRVIWFIPFPIPCIPMNPISVGSCTYKICDIIKTYVGPYCQTFNNQNASWKAVVPCGCPLAPGTYGLQDMVIGIPIDLFSILEGDYDLSAKVLDRNSKEIGCLTLRLKI